MSKPAVSLRKIWYAMVARCTRPGCTAYQNYGGRGIRVCPRWMTFENFRADMGERPARLELDRIDNDGDYAPGNCRWTDRRTQMRNRRANRRVTLNGREMLLCEAAEALGESMATLKKRADAGAPLDERRGIRLTVQAVAEIRSRAKESPTLLGREFGVTRQTINAIRRGATW